MPSTLEREIAEQPAVLSRLLHEGRAAVATIAARLRAYAPHSVVIAARGSSDNAARYAQYVLGAHNELSVGLAAPSLFTLYGARPSLRGALVVGVSQSGRSPDIVAVLDEARRQGALTLSVTNAPDSPLARAAELHLALGAGAEEAIAATKSYTAQLCALAMLSAELAGDAARWADLATLPERVAAALAVAPAADAAARRLARAARIVVIGRGYNYATAFELALKIKETSYLLAEPYSSADFRHGPVALIERGFPVLLVAPSGRAAGDVADLLALLDERGAEVVAITDRDELVAGAVAALRLPPGVPEWLSPLVAVVPGQLFALGLARARGLDPDRPRGLAKVTETR